MRPVRRRGALVLTALAVVAGCAASIDAVPSGAVTDSGSGSPFGPAPGPVRYRPPVDAPVVDPFRPPAGPYGPGNRGLEYATITGTAAASIGSGIVVFAGPVAGRGVVSVVHPDGLRSSLTGLAVVLALPGQVVRAGTTLGTTGDRLHLGVRVGERYIDPAVLFGDSRPRHAVLVPTR
jgi:murein DD-endopeptidase MepM/ murein hydrolase activator NlpD